MTKPCFIRIPRTDGRMATIRADAITALLPGTGKGGVEEVAISLGPTMTVHTTLAERSLVSMIAASLGTMPVVIEPDAA